MGKMFSIVGHRGFPERYPENTLDGLVAAAKLGIDAVELDVQMSADGIPVVIHDSSLDRTANECGNVWNKTFGELCACSVHEPERFGIEFYPTPVSSLADVALALSEFDCQVFVEIKEESLQQCGMAAMLSAVLEAVELLGRKALIISFDYDVLLSVRQTSALQCGWVLTDMSDAEREKLARLTPDVLIYDVKKLSLDSVLWEGPWDWFLYDITDLNEAKFWAEHGVRYIESWNPQALLA